MEKHLEEFAFNYLKTYSPTGFEAEGQKRWLDFIKPHVDDVMLDTYGTAVGIINPNADYKVVIEAHADEISWFVNYITNDGMIYLIRNGGSDAVIAPSKRVVIHTENGLVPAVFGWPAIHVRKDENPMPNMKNIFLDCGCSSKDEVEKLGVHVGCVVTFTDEPMLLNNRYLVARALDNRIGGIMIAEVARRLHQDNIKLPFTLYVVNSVQEEIGLRGAGMIAANLQPDIAIITDVCHDTSTPMYNKILEGDTVCGKGAVLSVAPSVQNNLLRMITKTAQEKQIPFQRKAAERSTGTDTESFAYMGKGIASALISIPLRYMHTTVEACHLEDIENVIKLMYEFLVQLPAHHNFRYFDPKA